MRCKHCNTEANILDRFCHSCGKSLSFLDEGPQRQSEDVTSLSERVSTEIEEELVRAEEDLFSGSILSKNSPVKQSSGFGTPTRSDGFSFKLGYLSPPKEINFLSSNVLDLATTDEDVQQIAKFVFYSTHVQTNPMYKERASRTNLKFLPRVDVVNAFATEQEVKGIDVAPPLIAIFGGMANATRLAAIGLGIDAINKTNHGRQILVSVIKSIGESIINSNGGFSLKDSEKVFEQLGLAEKISSGEIIRKGRSYAASMNMAVIAHELGHIALGHTLGRGHSSEISRNQEREADSFASSVASASPFSDYIVAGGIFWWVILTWVESIAGNPVEATHPHSRDRLMDYIRANREQALGVGIDETTVVDLIP